MDWYSQVQNNTMQETKPTIRMDCTMDKKERNNNTLNTFLKGLGVKHWIIKKKEKIHPLYK